jgi:lipopolysaccharide export system permease protein
VFNIDAYRNFFNRLRGKLPERTLELKEVIMVEVEPLRAAEMLDSMLTDCREVSKQLDEMNAIKRRFSAALVKSIDDKLNQIVDYLSNSRDIYVINLLNKYPFKVTTRNLHSIIDTTRQLTMSFTQTPNDENIITTNEITDGHED